MLERGYQEKSPPPTTLVRLAFAVALMAATVLGSNWAIGELLDYEGTNLGYRYVTHKWKVLGDLDEPVDWLVLGDSAGALAVDPAQIERETGKRSVNLGTIGAFGLTDDAWMLHEYVYRFGAPEKVVLVHVYDIWRRRLRTGVVGRIPRDWVLADETIERFDFTDEQIETIWLVKWARMYAERKSLRKTLEYMWYRHTRSAEEFDIVRKNDPNLPPKEPELHDNGLVEMCGALPEVVQKDASRHHAFVRRAAPRISKDNRAALLSILKSADEHGFEVYVVPAPVYEGLAAAPNFQRYHAGLVQQWLEIAGNRPHFHVVEEPLAFPMSQLQNVDHISCDAIAKYTGWLVGHVK